MSSDASEPQLPENENLQSMLDRLRAMLRTLRFADPQPGAAEPKRVETPLVADSKKSKPPQSVTCLAGKYALETQISARGEVVRFRALDYGGSTGPPAVVAIIRSPAAQNEVASANVEMVVQEAAPTPRGSEDGVLQDAPLTESFVSRPAWPSVDWEMKLLEEIRHPALPRILDRFGDQEFQYLVEEVPLGRSLWDAWQDSEAKASDRFRWLTSIAQALNVLHERGVILEKLAPDMIVVTPEGQARLKDLSGLLALPLPSDICIEASYYTAPELNLASDKTDCRADLYGFGALVYALHLGRDLADLDFEHQGIPKVFLDHFPDVHPLLGLLISKTFCRNVAMRFPTQEASRNDASGFQELLAILELCARHLDQARLDIAGWSTTGMARTDNEDAYSVISTSDARQDNQCDSALILLADGMGGHEQGEVAAALALQTMRDFLLPAFGRSSDACADMGGPGSEYEKLLEAALKAANDRVYEASSSDLTDRQMGCTAEAVYVDGQQIIVGHVGDSRVYHESRGNLVQLTRDHTWVGQMVELRAMTPEDAATHPRRSEIQQAIGGNAVLEPDLIRARLAPGDWVLVCSDGLSNHLSLQEMQAVLLQARSAESAARRLVNAANLRGANDNVTVVVVRAT
jgi:protein phosphatase